MDREIAEHKAEHETLGSEVSAAMSGESAALGQGTANPKAMTRATVRALCQLNTEFYERNAASFSQTRTAPWEGWRRCMAACCGFDGLDEAALDQSVNAQAAGQPANAQTADRAADADAQAFGDQSDEQATKNPAFHGQASAIHPIDGPSTEGIAACDQAAAMGLPAPRSLTRSVLDIACGNLRFEAFLANTYPHIDWSFFAVDNCEPLVASGQEDIAKKVHFACEDIVSNLLEGLPAAEPANIPALAAATPFDLVVSFGFLHHIPSFDLRQRFLLEALSQVKPGGYLVVSFWQFLNDPAKRAKIEQTHAEALAFFAGCAETRANDRDALDRGANNARSGSPNSGDPTLGDRKSPVLDPSSLEPNDYFLGWKNEPGNYRYCHHFSNEEIDRIITTLAPHATVIESFSADGKPGNLNRYVVFKREVLPIDSIPVTNALSSMTDEEIRQHKVETLTLS